MWTKKDVEQLVNTLSNRQWHGELNFYQKLVIFPIPTSTTDAPIPSVTIHTRTQTNSPLSVSQKLLPLPTRQLLTIPFYTYLKFKLVYCTYFLISCYHLL